MTPREFVIWMKGFVQAANKYNITPKQWEDAKDMLNKVDINQRTTTYTIPVSDSTKFNSTGKITTTTYNNDVLTTDTIF